MGREDFAVRLGLLCIVVACGHSASDDGSAIAVAGHTNGAFFVSDGTTVTDDLLAALNSIRADVGH